MIVCKSLGVETKNRRKPYFFPPKGLLNKKKETLRESELLEKSVKYFSKVASVLFLVSILPTTLLKTPNGNFFARWILTPLGRRDTVQRGPRAAVLSEVVFLVPAMASLCYD